MILKKNRLRESGTINLIIVYPETNLDKFKFPIRKSAILGKLKKIPQIDTEIAQKGHFRMETNYFRK